jgi:hypothetical protein
LRLEAWRKGIQTLEAGGLMLEAGEKEFMVRQKNLQILSILPDFLWPLVLP